MTALSLLRRPDDGSRTPGLLLENWTKAVTPDRRAGRHVSFRDLVANEERYQLVEQWLTSLDETNAVRVWGLHDRLYKQPLTRDPPDWAAPYAIWHAAQLAMSAVARGDTTTSTAAPAPKLPDDVTELLTDEEIASLFPKREDQR